MSSLPIDNIRNHRDDVDVVLNFGNGASRGGDLPVTYWHAFNNVALTQASANYNFDYAIDNVLDPVDAQVRVEIEHTSGTLNGTVKLQGKVFWQDAWTDLDTETLNIAADTTVTLEITNKNAYRFLRVEHDPGATAQAYTVAETEIKIFR